MAMMSGVKVEDIVSLSSEPENPSGGSQTPQLIQQPYSLYKELSIKINSSLRLEGNNHHQLKSIWDLIISCLWVACKQLELPQDLHRVRQGTKFKPTLIYSFFWGKTGITEV